MFILYSEVFPIIYIYYIDDASLRGLRPTVLFSLRLRYDIYAGTVTSQNKYILNSYRKTGKT